MKLPESHLSRPEINPGDVTDLGYLLFQWHIRRVKADAAWNVTTGSHGTVVAVVDTGIAWNHPDLAPNVVYDACFDTQGTCIDYPDVEIHGTFVAGLIAAAIGGGYAVGVGPDLGLASYKVFEPYDSDYVAFDSSIWAAMLDAAEHGFQVVNLSLGGYVLMPNAPDGAVVWTAWNRFADYITRQGVTIVASAGNAGANLNGPVAHVPSDLTGVISVGATGIRPDPVYPQAGADDVPADYSNYGAPVTLVAPGGDLGPQGNDIGYLVFSTGATLNPACAATASCDPAYYIGDGTSFSAPHVSGVAGLVIDHSGADPYQVNAILKQTAEKIGSRQMFGHGMVNAAMAVGAE